MDERAILLLEELTTHPRDQNLDFDRWRQRFQAVLAEPIDEESRVVVLDGYKSILDLFERALEGSPDRLEDFRKARETDWRVLCLQEAQIVSRSELFHPAILAAIVDRELAAGRMQENDFTEMAKSGAQAFAQPKKGWFSRLFGR